MWMKISLTDAGKRFNRDWIFRHLTTEFSSGHSYAIVGPNGSGKSTLLQVLGSSMQLNEGNINYCLPVVLNEERNKPATEIVQEDIYRQVAICAPYLDVIEEMTLVEFLHFHSQFKSFLHDISINGIIDLLGLQAAAHKQIRYFSSGMKQRVKLAQCIFSDTMLVLLDEPCTNLDTAGIDLYHQLIKDYCSQRLVVVSSNDEVEFSFCETRIDLRNYK
jgi:ABC-type multidrug transport system ATPase subunit